jgi:hypothetical protein
VGSPICKLTPRSYLGKPWPFSPAGVKKRCWTWGRIVEGSTIAH